MSIPSAVLPRRVELRGGVSVLLREATGPAVRRLLLVHPANLQAASWDPVVAHLPADWDYVAVDLPGHGRSARRESYDLATWATACRHVLDELGWPAAHGVGASVGAAVLAALAAADPARLTTLTSVGGACRAASAADTAEFLGELERLGARELLRTIVAGEPGLTPAQVAEAVTHTVPQAARAQVAAIWRAAAASAALDHVDGILCPVLAVVGEHDLGCPVADSAELARRTGGRLAVLAGQGHLPIYGAAGDVADLVRAHVLGR
ncbi:alpha/beta hydrolase [Nocardioides sp. LHD-245]|uniref:alpha/beta fold hydrolase n=1 Tax=Nocardioides sp. LHD-245 TaxID=3051387 RepID=UPI0027E0C925|nr:alpha/beta hydrolase [Nocardioides sp. LHD-245]